MDNMDDSENNAKISDSAYSNSCSNSQSRRSHSSKSTHSGSHSSGSSGYGGKPSTSASSNTLSQAQNKEKKKQVQAEVKAEGSPGDVPIESAEPEPIFAAPQPQPSNVVEATFEEAPELPLPEDEVDPMDISQVDFKPEDNEEASTALQPVSNAINPVPSIRPNSSCSSEGFSCVISMHDGVVMYTTTSITSTLGYPKELWIGRSFIEFLHPRDRNTFASQITNGLAIPKPMNGAEEEALKSGSTMVCRIRRYRSLNTGFGVRDKLLTYMPYFLKFSFKYMNEGTGKLIYLMIQAAPFYSAFKVPNEVVEKPVPFVIRHAANGNLEYIDPESVPYLGYLPQDLQNKDALQLYHPDDLPFLRQIYEKIVREGSALCTKPYRMMTQNGDFIKLETEWSSFINPWSMKLEFIIGKHYIVEGPSNPDVFQSPEIEKYSKFTEDDRIIVQGLRESIIRIMNEVLTKPAEAAKQQMSKRCQDLASFMETLIEDAPKPEEEVKMEIQEPEHSYYERDSVMLGGISPHHDYDSKSSTETPLSYNQLNYNVNLQRYFDSHQPFNNEDPAQVTTSNPEVKSISSKCLSPMAQNSGDSNNEISSCDGVMPLIESPGPSDHHHHHHHHHLRLTESLLSQHNAEMEKELVKMHRESRSSSKDKREKASNETRLKKKAHLARCNASFQPTAARASAPPLQQSQQSKPHGLKRPMKYDDGDATPHKHHCPTYRRRSDDRSTPPKPPPPITAEEVSRWPTTTVGTMNTYYLGPSIPAPLPIMAPIRPMQPIQPMQPMQSMHPGMATLPAMPAMHTVPAGMIPMYYAPAPLAYDPRSATAQPQPSTSMPPPQQPYQPNYTPVPYVMYGQPVYGQPYVYSPINPQMTYPMQHPAMEHNIQYGSALGLTTSNYEEACKLTPRLPSNKTVAASKEKRSEPQMTSKPYLFSGHRSTTALKRSTEAVPDLAASQDGNTKNTRSSDNATLDRTDGESSYSSFYSSFFKTESGSATDSGDQTKKVATKGIKNGFWTKTNKQYDDALSFQSSTEMGHAYKDPQSQNSKKVPRRKMDPPWMEQVCVTSELTYKYQVVTKPLEEVLEADRKKIEAMEQPPLVNEQLGQLYLDLQLEGVAARLTLEEGITSSSSSGEETSTSASKAKRKREYSRLTIIHEEDAPLPPPLSDTPSEPVLPSHPISNPDSPQPGCSGL